MGTADVRMRSTSGEDAVGEVERSRRAGIRITPPVISGARVAGEAAVGEAALGEAAVGEAAVGEPAVISDAVDAVD